MSDEKYIAPPWIKYPTNPKKSEIWNDGSCAEYLIKFNKTIDNMDEYLEIFPEAPTFTQEPTAEGFSNETMEFLNNPQRPIFIKLWTSDGKPKYEFDHNLDENTIYMYDSIISDKSTHLHIGRDTFESVEDIIYKIKNNYDLTPEVYDEIKYTIYLNALYYKIICDINFTKELIKTGNYPIVFKSSNLEWGVSDDNGNIHGENLFGLAMMQIRDEICDVFKNYDMIDWEVSGKPYSQERCMCHHHH
ncbi:MAG: hypothetical protein SOZ23_07140 [Methanosphaera sp.]|uniref:hypothetical protein n=1 Tax=Methanosphaera sp. TaxID=2666342 RepID=UPI0025EF815C|nr:hypothetical protein [Methanosphaera sp.]MCI5867079.1 hypothetical protein [Methanosphaera sp.]MDD6535215.1 hypothetical protein [Methanosphaera sp.]MDY3956535.1 hypothetical protein [Methanosphaera sp.]